MENALLALYTGCPKIRRYFCSTLIRTGFDCFKTLQNTHSILKCMYRARSLSRPFPFPDDQRQKIGNSFLGYRPTFFYRFTKNFLANPYGNERFEKFCGIKSIRHRSSKNIV